MRRALLPALVLLCALPSGALSERSVPTVTVEAGDTLSSIAEKYADGAEKSALGWPRWAYVNRATTPNPHLIEVGQVLIVPQKPGREWNPIPPRPSVPVSRSYDRGATGTGRTDSTNPYVDPWGCEAETAQDWSPDGRYWGKYQWDRQTWAAHGGDPDEYGSASEAEQDRVAANERHLRRMAELLMGGRVTGFWLCLLVGHRWQCGEAGYECRRCFAKREESSA